MVIQENWAISPERIRQFLLQQPEVQQIQEEFQFRGCRVCLTPHRGMLMGKWPQERTVIRMEGPEADTKEIYHRFFLRFLSAGG